MLHSFVNFIGHMPCFFSWPLWQFLKTCPYCCFKPVKCLLVPRSLMLSKGTIFRLEVHSPRFIRRFVFRMNSFLLTTILKTKTKQDAIRMFTKRPIYVQSLNLLGQAIVRFFLSMCNRLVKDTCKFKIIFTFHHPFWGLFVCFVGFFGYFWSV